MKINHIPNKELFNNNLQLLPIYIRDLISEIMIDTVWNKIHIENSFENTPICSYVDDSKNFLRLNSEAPLKEAELWCNQIPFKKTSSVIVYGCGFGYPLFEILKQKEPNTLVFVFEHSIEIFIAMLYYFDLKSIIESNKFIFFIGEINQFSDYFLNIFNSDLFFYSTAPLVVFTSPAKRALKKEYLKIHSYIFEQLSLNLFHIGNDHYDTLLGFHNIIANVEEIISSPSLSCLENKFQNTPVFIISNGPSLDKNIMDLKKIAGKGLIISTESAILPLMKNKIKPDILCVIERIENSYLYHFKDKNYPDDISLLALALINKNIFPSFSGPKIPIFRNTESINMWINKFLGESKSSIDAGANVSHLAFEIAVYIGANPIIFVGQDFAFDDELNTHSKNSIYSTELAKKDDEKFKKRPTVYTRNITGDKIKTSQLWLDFKHGLERKIATHSEKIIIDATEGGAEILGTSPAMLSEIIQNYCKKPINNTVYEIINKHKEQINVKIQKQKINSFIADINNYIFEFRNLCQVALKALTKSNRMLELINKADISNNLDIFEKSYYKNFSDLKKFMIDNLFLVFFQQVLLIGFHKMNQLGTIDSKDNIKEIFSVHKELFYNLNIISQSIVVNFENAIEEIKASLKI